MAKIIVTGGAGFIGSHLVDKLIEKGHEIIILDDLSSGKKENINSQATFHKADIRELNEIKNIFKGINFVFHLAAIPGVPVSVKDPLGTSEVNISGTLNVFKAGIDGGVERIISASSSAVYGDQKTLPLRENMEPRPISPYGLQKLVGEQFAKLFSNIYKVPIISLRYFNVYGPRINFESDYSLVLGKFLLQNREKKPLTIFGDGKQTRAFCFVDDLVSANILAMESEKLRGGEVINVGSEKSHAVNYVADLVGGERQYLSPRAGDVLHTKADISRARELLNWEPKVSFEQGVKKTQEWFNGL